MFCDKFAYLFFLPLLIIVWRDVDGRDVKEGKIVVNPVDWGTVGGKKGATGDEKGGEVEAAEEEEEAGEEEAAEGAEEEEQVDAAEEEEEVDAAEEEEEDQPNVDATKNEDASPEKETPQRNFPAGEKKNHQNNMDDIINEYYRNVIIPKESKDIEEMEAEKKNVSFFTKIKNFFSGEKEEEEKQPSTLIEYIRQKNKKIMELEEESAKRISRKHMYEYLFWTTAYILFNVAIAPLITYYYVSRGCKKAIMREYNNNRDRRIVPYGYDFSDEGPSVNFSGMKFRNCKYYPPQRGSNFSFLMGMLHGKPYAIVKL
ncbi:hypothetical protein PCYB_053710 [Plasmodium cynomolgi strain B]|uniref:CYIR protein n=1 Tax=Plasmodium cynomolgi (strain B) TaxID=1120755 RepID=K6UIU7_PLACD|nr:hypothetical protein PCYB_053710 [Plasmodium cynomolgi strain B]GAB65353.1 hypothetical protein PCYB_053710 [Plasmodium cynomolgi strain B]